MWSKLLYEAVPDDARFVTSSGYRMEYCSPKESDSTFPLELDLSKGRKLVVTVGSKDRGLFDEQPPVLTIEDLEGIVGAACVLPGIKELMKIERELAFRENGSAYFVVSFEGSRDADFVGRHLSSYNLARSGKSIHALTCERTVLKVGEVVSLPEPATLDRRGALAEPTHPWRLKPASLATDDEVAKQVNKGLSSTGTRRTGSLGVNHSQDYVQRSSLCSSSSSSTYEKTDSTISGRSAAATAGSTHVEWPPFCQVRKDKSLPD